MSKKYIKKESGYTIIETMIAVSLFIIIVMAGMGALFNANLLHNKSQNMRSIIDNLSFVLEDMSKNLRVGSNYYCILGGQIPDDVVDTNNCPGGGAGISFKSGYDDSQWVYYWNNDKIFRKIDDADSIQMTPEEIDIENLSFIVTGAESPPDPNQPFVTIKLAGTITYKDIETPFSLQTSVSQRMIDR